MTQANSHEAHETVLAVSGMTCGGCANTVTRILSRVPGVVEAQVDHKTGLAIVKGDVPSVELIAAVQAAGYGAANTSTGGTNNGD